MSKNVNNLPCATNNSYRDKTLIFFLFFPEKHSMEVHLFPVRWIRAESLAAVVPPESKQEDSWQMTPANWKTNEVQKSRLDSAECVCQTETARVMKSKKKSKERSAAHTKRKEVKQQLIFLSSALFFLWRFLKGSLKRRNDQDMAGRGYTIDKHKSEKCGMHWALVLPPFLPVKQLQLSDWMETYCLSFYGSTGALTWKVTL